LSDLRSSAAYRRRTARGLLMRLWLETRGDAPLPHAEVSVWRNAMDDQLASLAPPMGDVPSATAARGQA